MRLKRATTRLKRFLAHFPYAVNRLVSEYTRSRLACRRRIEVFRYYHRRVFLFSVLSIIVLLPSSVYLARTASRASADSFMGFDEGQGTTINDAEGNASGTITNASWATTHECLTGNCLYFDGSGDYVSFGDNNSFDVTAATAFTIEFWFKTPDINSTTRIFLQKYNGSTGSDGGYLVSMGQDGRVNFAIDDDNSYTPDDVASSVKSYDDSRWHHVVAVKNGTASLLLYLDSVLVGQDLSIAATNTLVNTDSLYLGISGDSVSNPYLGYIDELKIYTSSARSSDQVKTDFQRTTDLTGNSATFGSNASAISHGLLGYWPFEAGGIDVTGNGNGLKNIGTTSISGKFGLGREYIAASSQFEYVSSNRLNNPKTISFWANPDSTTTSLLSLNNASIQANAGVISTTGLINPKIFVNGVLSTTLIADTWQYITITTDSVINGSNSGFTPAVYQDSSTHLHASVYCLSDTDCKMAYTNPDDNSLRFMDCDDASCTTGSVSILDGEIGCTLTGGDGCSATIDTVRGNYYDLRISLYCPTADDCKVSYYDVTNTALKFADCADATCSSGSVEILDGMSVCGLTGCVTSLSAGYSSSLICPTADDCKIAYYDTTNTALKFADCNNATCSSGSVEILDGAASCVLTDATNGDVCDETIAAGYWNSLSCPTASDCKIAYYDTTNTALMFADCADATCSSGSVQILDGNTDGTNCSLSGGDVCDVALAVSDEQVSLACPAADDCKISYSANSDLYFADCNDAYCASGSSEMLDGMSGCGLTGCSTGESAPISSLSCSASDDCKIVYQRSSNIYFADCSNGSCSSGVTRVIDGLSGCSLTGGDGCEPEGESGVVYVTLFCVTADNCKVIYQDYNYSAIRFGDCDDATCSSGSVNMVSGENAESNNTHRDIYCLTPDDCKMVYVNGSDTSLRFIDCDNESCSSGAETIIDGAPECMLNGGDGCRSNAVVGGSGVSLYCPAADDCKISYHNGSYGALMFADCDNATCSSGSVEILDGYTGCGLTGGDVCDTSISVGLPSLYCPAADDCKIGYRDITNSALMFADCDNATCSSGSVEILDGYTGCGLSGGDVCDSAIDVTPRKIICPAADDCKIAYYDTTNTALMFADCDNATCSSGSVEILDGYTGCGLTGGDVCDAAANTGTSGGDLACPAADDCKIAYYDTTNTALMFADCDNATCSSGSTELLDGDPTCSLTGGDGCRNSSNQWYHAIKCPAADDCKIAFLGNTGDTQLIFADCDNSSCSAGSWEILDGYTGCGLTEGDGCNVNRSAGEFANYMSCPTADNCKINYLNYNNRSYEIMFADCANGSCSSGSTEFVATGLPTTIKIGKTDSGYFDGTIDELRIYNRVLTPIEITTLYNTSPGEIAHWNLDENTGTVAHDSSGNNYIGTLTNGVQWSTGVYGSGINFDGTNDYVDIGSGPATIKTVSFWVKPATTTEYLMNLTESSHYIWINGGVLTATGFNSPRYYVNGVATSTVSANQWQYISITTDTAVDANNLDFGRTQDTNYLEGMLDDVKLYAYVISPSERITDFNANHPIGGSPINSAMAHYDFDEGYGGTMNNLGFAGSALNAALGTTTTAPTWISAGKIGKALQFDGSNDFAQTNSTVNLTGANQISVAFWLNWDAYANDDDLALESSDNYNNNDGAILIDPNASDGTFTVSLHSTGYRSESFARPSAASWHHYVFVLNGAVAGCETQVFVDGKEISTSVITGQTSCNASGMNFGNYVWNFMSRNGTSLFGAGKMDDFKLYTTALTPEQIQVVYNQSAAVSVGSMSNSSTFCIPGDSAACTPPVAEWKFDEGTGQTVNDSSGGTTGGVLGANANIGTDDPTWVNGKFGKALRFDGNDYIDAGNNSSLNISGSLTLEAWVKRGSLSSTSYAVISKGGLASGVTDMKYGLFLTAGNTYQMRVSKDGSSYGSITSTLTYSDLNWHHVVGVYTAQGDGTSLLDLYIDGKKAANQTANAPYPLYTNSNNVTLGYAGYHWPWNGLIDNVKIYNYARTAAQVAWDYNHGAPLVHFDMDECQGTTIHSLIPNSNGGDSGITGTISVGALGNTSTGTCSSGTDTEMWNDGTTGKFNAGLGFDGSDDTVSVADNTSLRFNEATSDFSLFAWVKRAAVDSADSIVTKLDANDDGWQLIINADNTVTCSVDARDMTSAATLNTDWHHVGCVVDRDGNGQVFIDGLPNGSATAISSEVMATTANISVGSTLEGLIDDLRIYPYAVTPTQVKMIGNNGAVNFR